MKNTKSTHTHTYTYNNENVVEDEDYKAIKSNGDNERTKDLVLHLFSVSYRIQFNHVRYKANVESSSTNSNMLPI